MAAATSFWTNSWRFTERDAGFWLRAERGINTRKRRTIGAEGRIVNGAPKYIQSSGILSGIHLMSAFDSVFVERFLTWNSYTRGILSAIIKLQILPSAAIAEQQYARRRFLSRSIW